MFRSDDSENWVPNVKEALQQKLTFIIPIVSYLATSRLDKQNSAKHFFLVETLSPDGHKKLCNLPSTQV